MNMLQFRNKAFKDRTGDMVMTVGATTTLPGTRGGQTEGVLMMGPQGSLHVAAGKDPCTLSRQHPSNISMLNADTPKLYENKK